MLYTLIFIFGAVALSLTLRETPFQADEYGRRATLTSPVAALLPVPLEEFNSCGCGKQYTVDLSSLGDVTDGFFIVLDPQTGTFTLDGDALHWRDGTMVMANDPVLHDGDEIVLRGASLIFTIE